MGKDDGQYRGQADGPQAAAVSVVVVSPRHRCVRCGYPSGVSGSVICPECGWTVTREALDADRLRRDEVESWGGVLDGRWARSGIRKVVHRWIVVIGIFTVGATVMVPSLEAFALTPLILLAAVGISWSLGWVVARLKPKDARAYTRMMWRRHLWRLHLPWMFAPVYMAAALVVGLVDRSFGLEGWVYWSAPPMAWVFWCLGVFLGWWKGYFVRGVGTVPGPRRRGLSEVAAVVLGGGTMLSSCGLGLIVGVFVMAQVAVWLGVDPGPLAFIALFVYGSGF